VGPILCTRAAKHPIFLHHLRFFVFFITPHHCILFGYSFLASFSHFTPGMPLHIVRELWISFANLRKCWQQYRKYQRLMRGLNDRFPDATEEDITAEGGGKKPFYFNEGI
jgi:hypothetical protein